jgi:hypothetical protein
MDVPLRLGEMRSRWEVNLLRRLEMAKSIYKVFLARPTEALYQLSPEEQDRLMAKVDEALGKAGGKRVVMCDSTWASEQWPYFGVEVFPDIEAVQKYAELLGEFNWFRYMKSMTLLGTEMPAA